MSPFKPHLEVLPEAQKETWPILGWTTTNRFVLYGGTAIALRCGHRASIDFDFFTDQPGHCTVPPSHRQNAFVP
jgi:hypothetical protein